MSKLFDDASLAMIPSAYKDGKLYSIRPIPEYGSELVTNGSFDTDSDWTKQTGWTISGGTANCDGTNDVAIYQNISSSNTTLKRITFSVSNYVSGTLRVYSGSGADIFLNVTANGTYELESYLVLNRIFLYSLSSFNGSVDNISVKEVVKGDGDFTFSRGSNLAATRVDVNGLIEKGRENLLKQSNNFDTTPWGGVSASVTPNATTAPDGTLTASKIVANTVNAQHRIEQGTTSSAGVKTFSVYLKQAEITNSWLRIGTTGCFIDLTNGAISSISSGIIASTEALANDWYRCSITKTNAAANEILRINAGVTDYIGDNIIGIFVWSSQYEEGLVATDYIETGASTAQAGILEDLPRLDYSGGASCPSLLLEPQRTNAVTHSEYFESSSWSKTAAGLGTIPVLTSNYGISPEGLMNASRLQMNLNGGTSGGDISYISYFDGFSTATNSVYLKSLGSDTTLTFRCGSTFESIVVTSEWQRFQSTDANGTDRFQLLLYGNSDSQSADVLIWGAQIENGSYPTSYIPTYGSAVTRNKDLCDLDNMNTSGISTSNNWTYFIDIENFYSGNAFWYLDSTSGDLAFVYSSSFGYRNTSNSAVYPSSWSFSPYNRNNTRLKMALRYDGSKLVVFMNGEKKSDEIDSSLLSSRFNDPLKQDRYRWTGDGKVDTHQKLIFDTALTDSECIALTTIA